MAKIAEALHQLYDATPAVKGKRFERLMKAALERHPGEFGAHRFEQVWLWDEWPERDGTDYGIDLVAKQTSRFGGGLCAIQCKFYDPLRLVPQVEVAKFIAAAANDQFAARLFISTADLAAGGRRLIDKASPRCELITVESMDGWVEDWTEFIDRPEELVLRQAKHEPREDQENALADIHEGFERSDRGKLILPCGTGKSLVAMWAAEREVGRGGTVLYFVPSLALISQTMSEWARHRRIEHGYIGVCSDPGVGKKRDDLYGGSLSELLMPVTTEAAALRKELAKPGAEGDMRVVFCTYQSAGVVAEAIADSGFQFDLMVCDEAHRTTGLQKFEDKMSDNDKSGFLLVHDNEALPSKRRLFMTATPRVFTDRAKQKADELRERYDVDSYSMDDEQLYGPEFHSMTFGDAVDDGLLSDYRVVIVAVDQDSLSADLQAAVDAHDGINLQNAIRLTGCWDALADPTTWGPEAMGRPAGKLHPKNEYLRTAIAYANTVKTSKAVAEFWQEVVQDHSSENPGEPLLKLDVKHIDGSTPAVKRAMQIARLREPAARAEGVCRVLSNARVLTEGVDVPALDAITFLESRKSKIDITQAVGRVMRRSPDKEIGYVILPVVVPQGGRITDDEVLSGSDFKVVWDVLKALRSHDQRIDYWVNNVKATAKKAPIILLNRTDDDETDNDVEGDTEEVVQAEFEFQLDDKVASKLVEMVGDRNYWPTWGQRAAKVCNDVEEKLQRALGATPELAAALNEFVTAIQKTVGPHVSAESATEMVAQHVVTIPVFDHMFADSQFAAKNPVSAAITSVLERLEEHGVSFEKERAPLERAYRQMHYAFDGAISNAEKVDILRQIYEGFFAAAMKDTVKQLGIVYTPVPLVDFILRSADAVCRQEFGYGLTAENVNILDPFAGTGTFLYQLLTLKDADGQYLIRDEDLLRKYRNELHANEIVLLAYYIAALKIEAGMAERGGFPSERYEEFDGVVLADSMLMQGDSVERAMAALSDTPDNSARARAQAQQPITVILTNPPWSAGMKQAGDSTEKLEYPHVVSRVQSTYGAHGGGKALGNLYVQALRWMTDRLNQRGGTDSPGIIAFVHPNSLADSGSLVGARAVLRDEFEAIYVVNLRGNANTQGIERRNEGDNVFGQGTKNGVQVTILVRNSVKSPKNHSTLHYAAVPDAMKRPAKLSWLQDLSTVLHNDQFITVPVNDEHHWVNLTDGTFADLLPVCDTRKPSDREHSVVDVQALGVATNLDAFAYSFSRSALMDRINTLIRVYSAARSEIRAITARDARKQAVTELAAASHEPNIKWTDRLKKSLINDERIEFDESRIREAMYRPFTKLWLYEDDRILSSVKTIAALFPQETESADGADLSAWSRGGGGGKVCCSHLRRPLRSRCWRRTGFPISPRSRDRCRRG